MNDSACFAEWQHRIAVHEDEEAFLHLYRYFRHRLEKFAFSICHSKQDAEDIVEDVFVKIWAGRKTIDQVLNLKLYLYIATRNFSINYCKFNQRNEHFDPYDLKIELQDIAPDPQQQFMNAELAEIINEVIKNLPTNCKAIYKLVKEDGLKHKEVAEILHLSPKTVENQLAIAVKRIALAIGREKKPKTKKI